MNPLERLERFDGLERNVGGWDRRVRAVLAVLLLATSGAVAAGLVEVGGFRWPATSAALVGGLGLLFNAVTGFCGANYVLGVDTCSIEAEDD